MSTMGQRLLTAYADNGAAALAELYHPDAVAYGAVHWPARGRDAIVDAVRQTHARFPELAVSLHDEFASADGRRVALRWVSSWPGPQPNTSSEVRMLTVEDGRIVEEFLGYATLESPRRLITDPNLTLPRDTPDPNSAIVVAQVDSDLGYPAPKTIPQRWVDTFGRRDLDGFTDLYADDFTFYTAVAWGLQGKEKLPGLADGFHVAFPGVKVTLTDEFTSADGTRVGMRFVLDWHNTGEFFGNPATGERGTMVEQHMLALRDGRIVEQVVADVSMGIPRLQFENWKLEVAPDTPDPKPALASAGASR